MVQGSIPRYKPTVAGRGYVGKRNDDGCGISVDTLFSPTTAV